MVLNLFGIARRCTGETLVEMPHTEVQTLDSACPNSARFRIADAFDPPYPRYFGWSISTGHSFIAGQGFDFNAIRYIIAENLPYSAGSRGAIMVQAVRRNLRSAGYPSSQVLNEIDRIRLCALAKQKRHNELCISVSRDKAENITAIRV